MPEICSIPFKDFTKSVLSRTRISHPNFNIVVQDTRYILLKDFFELYLKLFYSKNVRWSDRDNTLKQETVIINVARLLLSLLIFLPRLIWIMWRINKLKNLKPKKFPINPLMRFFYLRTDHWFKLTFGGSVGHTAGVINSLFQLGQLGQVVTTDQLFEINPDIKQQVISPDYTLAGNIPDFPPLDYNHKLVKTVVKNALFQDCNIIYQRYSIGNISGIQLKYLTDLPLVLEFNGSEVWAAEHWGRRKFFFHRLFQRVELINLKHADLIVVVSDTLKRELIELAIPEHKVLVNPNGVDILKFNPEINGHKIRERLELTDQCVFGFIGTFSTWHGVELLTSAILEFYDRADADPNVHFLLIGDGPLRNECQETIRQSKYGDKVTFTGQVAQHQAPYYLAACDVFLSPHIPNPDGSDFFGSPTKIFEYMAMGKPIIASKLGQMEFLLEHKHTAWLVEPGNRQDLLLAIKTLLTDRALREKLGKNALIEVTNKYTWEQHVKNIIIKLEELSKK